MTKKVYFDEEMPTFEQRNLFEFERDVILFGEDVHGATGLGEKI